jgi:transcriptional regulator with XRE-family HTH domain
MSRRKRPVDLALEPTYLLEWRKFREMTLVEVGKEMGVDKTAVSKLERGLSPYDQIHLQQLSKLYNAAIPDLLYTDPKRQNQPNQFGTVGFEHPRQVRKKVVPKTPADSLADLIRTKVTLPEEVDALNLIVEALVARRKAKDETE